MVRRIIFGRKHNKIDPSDVLVGLKTIDHYERLYQKLGVDLENFDEVHIFFLLDRSKYIRHIIKDADSLLKNGGKLIVHATNNRIHASYLRSLSQIKSEISLCIKDRYHLLSKKDVKKVHSLEYKKVASVISNADSISKWTFGIITNGKDFDLVGRLVHSIEKQDIPDYEIIICGPKYSSENKNVVNIGDVISEDSRAPICVKKNRIVDNASFENVAIFHARYELPEGWFEGMKAFGNLFEFLILPSRTNSDGLRINDWSIFRKKFMAIYLLKYTYYNEDWYAQGGVIIAKRSILKDVPLSQYLHWDELEDVQFSRELKLKGYTVHVDKNNYLLTTSGRIKSNNLDSVLKRQLYMLRTFSLRCHYFIVNMLRHQINKSSK